MIIVTIMLMFFIFYIIPRFVDDAWEERRKSKDHKGLLESDVHLKILIGDIQSINDIPAIELSKLDNVYGCVAGNLNIVLLLPYTQPGKRNTFYEPLPLTFTAEKENSYSINIVTSDPQTDSTVFYSSPIISKNYTFKNTYYFEVRDITNQRESVDRRRAY